MALSYRACCVLLSMYSLTGVCDGLLDREEDPRDIAVGTGRLATPPAFGFVAYGLTLLWIWLFLIFPRSKSSRSSVGSNGNSVPCRILVLACRCRFSGDTVSASPALLLLLLLLFLRFVVAVLLIRNCVGSLLLVVVEAKRCNPVPFKSMFVVAAARIVADCVLAVGALRFVASCCVVSPRVDGGKFFIWRAQSLTVSTVLVKKASQNACRIIPFLECQRPFFHSQTIPKILCTK